jgi:hypothetical protein
LIDWQYCSILPLFLQCRISNTFQKYGDNVSESLILPRLPANFDDISEQEQFEKVLLKRKRQLHYTYVTMTEKLNEVHYHALSEDFSALGQKIFSHACAPWNGGNVSLKAGLIRLIHHWSKVA